MLDFLNSWFSKSREHLPPVSLDTTFIAIVLFLALLVSIHLYYRHIIKKLHERRKILLELEQLRSLQIDAPSAPCKYKD